MEKGFLGLGIGIGLGIDTPVRSKSGIYSRRPMKAVPLTCDFRKRRALAICAEAQALHLKGQTAQAIPIYGKSLRILPTAEAHAFLGWAYSAHHRYDLAVEECLKAIEIDPEYGNPYNDIGSYYVSQGKFDEAILWFERAKRTTRYESPHFPYLNLGRVYSAKGMKREAIREFEHALRLEPGEESCLAALRDLRASLFEVV